MQSCIRLNGSIGSYFSNRSVNVVNWMLCCVIVAMGLVFSGCRQAGEDSTADDDDIEEVVVEFGTDPTAETTEAPPETSPDDAPDDGTVEPDSRDDGASEVDPGDGDVYLHADSDDGVSLSASPAMPTESVQGQSNNRSQTSNSSMRLSFNPTSVTLGDDELFAGVPGDGPLTSEQVRQWLAIPEVHEPMPVKLPMGLDAATAAVQGVDANAITLAKIELGRQLYFDTRLSADNSISCATCHHPDFAWTLDTKVGLGISHQLGTRNSPVSFNRIVSGAQFWDGRAETLEEQAKGPIENPIEMGNTHAQAVEAVNEIEAYRLQFERIFGDEGVTIDTIAKAIATFERALVTGPAPYDYLERVRNLEQQLDEEELSYLEEDDPELFAEYQYAKQQVARMSESAIRGRDLFFSERANCTACHAGANFSDEQFHNLGVGMDADEPDWGRFVVTREEQDQGAFKTPTCRNLVNSAPYMHGGSQATLEDVIEWYDKGGHPNPYLSDKMKVLSLTDQEKQDLVAFLREGLEGAFPRVEQDRLPW